MKPGSGKDVMHATFIFFFSLCTVVSIKAVSCRIFSRHCADLNKFSYLD